MRVTRAQVPQHHPVGFQASNGTMAAKNFVKLKLDTGARRAEACGMRYTSLDTRSSTVLSFA